MAHSARTTRVVFAWHGLPYYAARLIAHLPKSVDCEVRVIGSESSTSRSDVEANLGQGVTWVDPNRPTRWGDIRLDAPDLFIHTGWSHSGFNSLARAVKRANGRVVSMIDNNKKENLRQLCGALAFRVFHRKRIDAAWVPGASGHELMRFFGLPETGIYQGVYGADPGVFPPGPRLASRPKQFVFVGQLIPRKAPDLLVRAFERFRSRSPDWRLVMIGDGPLRCSLSGESIEVVPFLPPDIIAERLRQSRFLVLPSHEEHWGLIVHEAALSGCGLILSDMVGSGPDLLTDRNGFLFRSADEAALYRTLCDAANTPEHMLDQMYEESIKVARRFGPEHFVRSFRQIAESVTHK